MFVRFVVRVSILFMFVNLTVGHIFVRFLSFMPTGWALLQIHMWVGFREDLLSWFRFSSICCQGDPFSFSGEVSLQGDNCFSIKQQLVTYRSSYKLESVDQVEENLFP